MTTLAFADGYITDPAWDQLTDAQKEETLETVENYIDSVFSIAEDNKQERYDQQVSKLALADAKGELFIAKNEGDILEESKGLGKGSLSKTVKYRHSKTTSIYDRFPREHMVLAGLSDTGYNSSTHTLVRA
ncbi:MAG: hypothetical protein SVC26_09595 [Pseudomonadota bacterium]|nr:hypothetical protein [Pseudomonadota bacterium]